MKKSTLLSLVIATTAVAAANVAYGAVPPVDKQGRPALTTCPRTTVDRIWHFDKVVFQLAGGDLIPINPNDGAALKALPRNTDLDIKIYDNPQTISDLESKVLTFLGAQPSAGNRQLLGIKSVLYSAVVCDSTPAG